MNTSLELLTACGEALGWALLHSLWQGLIVAAVLFIALGLLRRHRAAVRHAVCLLALLALAVVTARTAWQLRPAPVAVVTETTATSATQFSLHAALSRVAELDPAAPASRDSVEVETPGVARVGSVGGWKHAAPWDISWRERLEASMPWISAAWVFGVFGCSLRHCGGWWRVRALRRRGKVARPEWRQMCARLTERFGLRRGVRLLESAEAAGPMLAGLFAPVVLLPARLATGLSAAELEAILAHELAHLARRDAWSNFAQLAVETLFFYHPVVWLIGHRARQEREHAADDLALQVCTDRRLYAGALTRLAELQLLPSPALAATGGNLLARIRRIVQPAQPEPALSGWNAGVPALLTLLATLAVFAARADDAKIIAVAPGESIQAAIDGAPAGAVIRLGAGEWKERIVISRPLTLEGAGWEKTRITIEEPPAEEIGKEYAEANAALQAANTSEAVDKASIDLIRRARRPAVFVHSADSVAIRNLRVQGASRLGPDQGLTISTLVYFYNAKAAMTRCVVAGPFGDGVRIGGGADIEIVDSLVAAVWNTGIAVMTHQKNSERPASRLRLVDSEVRNCYHRCITIGPGCDSTTVERCRISGSAWHGIRYDSAAPTITGNAIFANARSGIYASGKTAAKVRDNLFWKNEMDGISCWFDNADTIEGNTFVANLREGLGIIGGAKPRLARNIFAGQPIAIVCSVTSERDGQTTPPGDPVLEGNLFWDNKIAVQRQDEKQAAPGGSSGVDPQFRDAAKFDFSLTAGSPARSAGVGAADPLLPAGPWPLLAEEKAIVPADDTRDSRSWSAPGAPKKSKTAEEATRKAYDDAKAWVADAFQLDDKAKREAAIERVRAAMASGNVDEARTGITAFTQLGPIEFDKASFRPAIRTLLGSDDIATRAAALSAFAMVGTEPDDLPRIFALADDSAAEIRDRLTGVIVAVMKYDLTGKPATEAILKLMAKLPRDSRSVAHALWGSKFSPEIEARVLEFCRDLERASNSDVGYNFFYGSLSTQANKSEASCQRLIELLAHPDTTNIAGRSAWGLQQGVDRAQYPLVAEAMMRVIEARSDGSLRSNALRCLRTYASAAQAPTIRALLAKPGVTGEFKNQLEAIVASIEPRSASTDNQPTKPNDPESMKLNNATLKSAAAALALAAGSSDLSAEDAAALREKVRALEQRLSQIEGKAASEQNVEKLREENKLKARQRAAEDRKRYQPEELAEIESLYQVANKNWRTDEARASLKKLLDKYDGANRTGCATLYMGQMSDGQERIDYLTRAVEKFSDTYYFDGCQVGGYGRYVLALTLWEKGEKDKARTLLGELKTKYKDATDHRGRPITELAESAEKEFAVKQ